MCIFKSKVVIHFSISGEIHAFMGLLPNPTTNTDKLRVPFPAYHCIKPIVSLKKPTTKTDNLGAKSAI